MIVPSRNVASQLLTAPFAIPRAPSSLGRALWLYLWLALRANRTGSVCRAQASLALDLHVSDDDIHSWLERLVETGLVDVSAPAPYLVIKLRFWSGHTPEPHDSDSVLPRAHAPGSLQQNSKKQASSSEDGGQGEGDLLAEARRILGTANDIEIRDLIRNHPASVVWMALHRVERTPHEQIRKSRLALFRFLLVTLTQRSHDHHPSHPT